MKKYILFVCWHNSGRSQMAEVYFNVYNKNPQIEALSAGTGLKWDGNINSKIIKLLKSKQIDILSQDRKYFPKILTEDLLSWAEKIYTMWCMASWCDNIGRSVDYDFWLDDPANDKTDLKLLWEDFENKIKPIIKEFN
jgi:arsenate reductase